MVGGDETDVQESPTANESATLATASHPTPNPHTAKHEITETTAAVLDKYTHFGAILPTASISLVSFHVVITLFAGYVYLGQLFLFPVGVTTSLAFATILITITRNDVDEASRCDIESFPGVESIINVVSTAMDIHTPTVVVYDHSKRHAKIVPLLTHFHDALHITTPLLKNLSSNELTAIIAHELAHIKNNDQYYRPYAAIAEFSGMLTAVLIFITAISHLLGIPLINSYPYPTSATFLHVLVGIVAGVIWHSSHGVAGKYRQTSEFTADATALKYVTPEQLYIALLKLNPNNPSLEIDSEYADFGADYPPLRNRLAHIRTHGYSPPRGLHKLVHEHFTTDNRQPEETPAEPD
ncbi:M48 family metallopeptidase [Salinibaculum rarum]|uniref:M48 family metallopeptidase n=1 Tax=Salinibaculum rarum TaxID=3058903 RepID=UPI00265DF64C|nr:M48 family metallopeptidase [Salinibaculum sp. KK48]